MEVSRQNPDMRDLESLISGIQQVILSLPCRLSSDVYFPYRYLYFKHAPAFRED